MNIHRTKKIGFLSTIIVHCAIIILCIFSSIKYHNIETPSGVEIEILAYSDPVDELNQMEEVLISEINGDNNEEQEKMLLDIKEDITIPNVTDTTNSKTIELKAVESISDKLEDLFIQINANKDTSNDNHSDLNTNVDVTVDAKETITTGLVDNYQLPDNRLAIVKSKPNYICNQTGTIIVRVWVNREGKTIKVEAGIRGTTDSSSCLIKEAESAALSTTWTPFLDAPEIQIGQITYNFYQN